MATDTAEPCVSLFMTSPVKLSLSPQSLKAVLPEDVNVAYWTAERRFLSPKTAKDVCSHDRQVMALVSRKRPQPDQAHVSSSSKKVSNIGRLLETLLENQQKLQKQITDMQQEHEFMQQEQEFMQQEQQKLQKQITDMQQEHEFMQQEHEFMQQEQEFYAPLNLTRPLAVVSLMASLLKLLNNFFMRQAHQRADVKDMKLVFPKVADISYFKSWWFLYHETMEVPGLSLQEFWSQNNQLGYRGSKRSVDSKKKRRVGTAMARLFAEKLNLVMVEAEEECITFVGPGMTVDMLRKAVGFYISVLRMDKNAGTHLLENLLVVEAAKGEQQLQYHRPTAKDPFKYVSRDLVITKDEDARGKGTMVLAEIISSVDKLGHLSCISPVVKWFGQWLLSSICSDEDDAEQEILAEKVVEEKGSSWEWCPELQCELCHQNGFALDKEGRQWTWYDNKSLLWSEDNGGWGSWEGNKWRKQF